MKVNSKKIAVLLTVTMIIVFIVLSFIMKGKKRKQFDELIGKIDREPKGCTALQGYENVQSDASFDPTHFAYMIYDAKGYWFTNDDEEQVYNALRYKTKPQIKAIEDYFTQKYGQNIMTYLKTFMNPEEIAKAQTIINNAV